MQEIKHLARWTMAQRKQNFLRRCRSLCKLSQIESILATTTPLGKRHGRWRFIILGNLSKIQSFSLRKLCLSNNAISDEGARSFANAIIVNQTIKEILLFDNDIGNDGVERLAVALETNHTIKNLDLSGNKISVCVIRALERRTCPVMQFEQQLWRACKEAYNN